MTEYASWGYISILGAGIFPYATTKNIMVCSNFRTLPQASNDAVLMFSFSCATKKNKNAVLILYATTMSKNAVFYLTSAKQAVVQHLSERPACTKNNFTVVRHLLEIQAYTASNERRLSLNPLACQASFLVGHSTHQAVACDRCLYQIDVADVQHSSKRSTCTETM